VHTLRDAFAARRARGQAALVAYLTAGFPDAEVSARALVAVAEAGADVIELGVPFSDPLADGPTIQAASFDALAAGMTLEGALALLRDFRRTHDTPVVVFSYLNPLLRFGLERFLEAAAAAGAQGLLVTDLPAGADPPIEQAIRRSPLDLVRLLAPTTPRRRIAEVVEGGEGFLYYISRTGVTGARDALREGLADEVRALREVVRLPIAVGFGISTPEQAAAVAGAADGVVVGSALVDALRREGPEGAGAFTAALRAAMDAAGVGPQGG